MLGHAAKHGQDIAPCHLLIRHANRYEERHYGQHFDQALDVLLVAYEEAKSEIESDNVVRSSNRVHE